MLNKINGIVVYFVFLLTNISSGCLDIANFTAVLDLEVFSVLERIDLRFSSCDSNKTGLLNCGTNKGMLKRAESESLHSSMSLEDDFFNQSVKTANPLKERMNVCNGKLSWSERFFTEPLSKITETYRPKNVMECFCSELYVMLVFEKLYYTKKNAKDLTDAERKIIINGMLEAVCRYIDDDKYHVERNGMEEKNEICSNVSKYIRANDS